MGNLANTLKRFFSNKNTVTIIGILLGFVVLYFAYQWRVSQAVTPVSVPYAKQEITSRTLITSDMVGTIQIPKSMVNSSNNIVTSSANVIGKYVTYGAIIPINSLFYNELLVTEDKMPDSAFADIPDGYTIYSLSVDLHSTYGNSIYPDNYIDLYIKATDEDNKIIFGKMIESIKVLAVKDSQGQHVFESATESRTPSELLLLLLSVVVLSSSSSSGIITDWFKINSLIYSLDTWVSPGFAEYEAFLGTGIISIFPLVT